jgi:HK97 family phage major capsid protein
MTEEIIQKLDEALKGINDVQEVAKRNSGRLDTLDNEQIKKITDDICDSMEKVQELEAKQKQTEENSKKIETVLCSMDNVKKSSDDKAESLAKDEFCDYLRNGIAMSQESNDYITTKMIEKSFHSRDVNKKELQRKDLQVQLDPDGGYWVRPEISNMIITRIFETSPVRQYANVVTINSDSLEIMIDDNEADSGGWVGETDSRGDTNTPKVGKLVIYAHELFAQPKATQKMVDDSSFDIERWLQQKVVNRMSRDENTAFVEGDGSKKPRGFLDYPAWATPGTYERGKIEQRISSTIGDFEADDVKNLQNDLIENYQPRAVWFMNRKTFSEVVLKKDEEGRYLLDPNSFKTGDTKILLGSNVVFMHDFPTIANDALIMAYGDLSIAYTVVDRIGIRVVRDIYTDKPYIKYYTTKRVGGDVTSYDALKILKVKAS